MMTMAIVIVMLQASDIEAVAYEHDSHRRLIALMSTPARSKTSALLWVCYCWTLAISMCSCFDGFGPGGHGGRHVLLSCMWAL